MKSKQVELIMYVSTAIIGSIYYGFVLYNHYNNTLGFHITPIDIFLIIGILTVISLIALLPLVMIIRKTLKTTKNRRKMYLQIYAQSSIYFLLSLVVVSTLTSNYLEGIQATSVYFIAILLFLTLHFFFFKDEHSRKANT